MNKLLLGLLVSLMFAAPALAVTKRVHSHVASNADLAASPYAAGSALIRDGYSTAGDAAPLIYHASNAACSLNAGAGDNGSQVRSSDGKCWLADFPASGVDVRQFGAFGDGITDVTTKLQAWATSLGASSVKQGRIPAGTYVLTAALLIPSDTRILCDPSASLKASAGWPGPGPFDPATTAGHAMIVNAHFSASVITDKNIVIDGCSFDWTLLPSATDATSVRFRMAQNTRVNGINCTNGDDCTAMLASDGTIVENSTATGILNACYDHWEAPVNAVVRNSKCSSALYGILFTGTDWASTTAQVGDAALISGNKITMTGNGAGIWANGLGTAGSGVKHVRIRDNVINLASTASCGIKSSGASSDIHIIANQIYGGASALCAIYTGPDTGGTPRDDLIANNILDALNIVGTTKSAIEMHGANDVAIGNRIISGNYASGIGLNGVTQRAIDNTITSGSGPDYNIDGGTNYSSDKLGRNATPTIAAGCGAGPAGSVAANTNLAGQVVVGGGSPTTCTINFGQVWGGTPSCTFTASAAIAPAVAANTAQLFLVLASGIGAGQTLNWNCTQSGP